MKPPFNTGMTVLDRSKFSVGMPVLMAKITPRYIGALNKESSDLLDLRGINKIVTVPGDDKKGVLFDPKIKSKADLSSTTLKILEEANAEYEGHDLTLGYDYWSMEDILRSILPKELAEVPTGFTIVGHIAHLNLRNQFLPYKNIIGQIVLDKNPAIRTVVNKLDSINTVYRTFDMEVLAGEPDFWVEHHESNCRFQFDFRKVYWNSRLHSEHERLVETFSKGQAVCDPFAGVGPFAIPAGKKQVIVFASDLNPDSADAMRKNVELNKVSDFVFPSNEDARDFIRSSLKKLQDLRDAKPEIKLPSKKRKRSEKAPEYTTIPVPAYFSHYVMNLPATAIEFLDAFRGLYKDINGSESFPMPQIHVHCFHKHAPTEREPPLDVVYADLAKRVSDALGHTMDPSEMKFHDVRKVSPTKEMYCITFTLPKEVAFA